ncbi:MAG: flavin reductase family protein [Oligoflexia bacterium]|nr:flavin reductase family protein [Oligoflexia bacterium]
MYFEALRDISYGLYIVTSKNGEKMGGLIVNTIMQVTSEPAKISLCINKQNYTYELIKKSGVFGVSVLEQETPLVFIGQWGFKSSKTVNKFENINYRMGEYGVPLVIDHSLSVMEASVQSELDVGTHVMIIAELKRGEILKEGAVLTYDHYRKVKRGKAPKTAPTFRND